MSAEKPKLYVGCALTNAPEDFVNEVEALKNVLATDWEVLKFLGLVAGTSDDVYDQDINVNVRNCDALLGVADYAATGLGWELGVADERGIPTLIVVSNRSRITRLPEGAPAYRDHIMFRRYDDLVCDVPSITREVFSDILRPTLQPMRGFETGPDAVAGE